MKWYKNIHRDKKALIISMILSLLIWASLQMSKSRMVERVIETRLVPHTGYALVRNYPNKLTLRISGSGWHLLALNIKNSDTWEYTLPKRSEIILSERILGDLIRKSFNSKGISIVSVTPSPLVLHQEKERTKTVPISVKVKAKVPRKYLVSGPVSILPDSITINGPKEQVEQIKQWELGEYTLSNLKNQMLQADIPLSKSIPEVNISADSVHLSLPIEEATEKQVMVPISFDTTYPIAKIFPNKAQVILLTPLGKYDNITSDKLHLLFFPDSINRYPTYPLILSDTPKYCRHIRTIPEYVEVYFK